MTTNPISNDTLSRVETIILDQPLKELRLPLHLSVDTLSIVRLPKQAADLPLHEIAELDNYPVDKLDFSKVAKLHAVKHGSLIVSSQELLKSADAFVEHINLTVRRSLQKMVMGKLVALKTDSATDYHKAFGKVAGSTGGVIYGADTTAISQFLHGLPTGWTFELTDALPTGTKAIFVPNHSFATAFTALAVESDNQAAVIVDDAASDIKTQQTMSLWQTSSVGIKWSCFYDVQAVGMIVEVA